MKNISLTASILMLISGLILLVYQIYKQHNSIAKDNSPYTMAEHQQKLLGRFRIYVISIGFIVLGLISIMEKFKMI